VPKLEIQSGMASLIIPPAPASMRPSGAPTGNPIIISRPSGADNNEANWASSVNKLRSKSSLLSHAKQLDDEDVVLSEEARFT